MPVFSSEKRRKPQAPSSVTVPGQPGQEAPQTGSIGSPTCTRVCSGFHVPQGQRVPWGERLTLARHPASARCLGMGTGGFRVLIRWLCDLGHHSCWAQWGLQDEALGPGVGHTWPTRPGPAGSWENCPHHMPMVLERPESRAAGSCLRMGSAIWCLRTPPLGSSESLGPWLLGHQLPGRESWEEARCPPTCLPLQLERLFTKTFSLY